MAPGLSMDHVVNEVSGQGGALRRDYLRIFPARPGFPGLLGTLAWKEGRPPAEFAEIDR